MFGALRQTVKTVAVAAAAFAGVGAAAFAEATSTPGKEGEYYVDLADGGYEIGYKGRDGKQVVEIYNKSGPAVYVGKCVRRRRETELYRYARWSTYMRLLQEHWLDARIYIYTYIREWIIINIILLF